MNDEELLKAYEKTLQEVRELWVGIREDENIKTHYWGTIDYCIRIIEETLPKKPIEDCPFCKGRAACATTANRKWQVWCPSHEGHDDEDYKGEICPVKPETSCHSTKQAAIAEWNTRIRELKREIGTLPK